MDIASMGLWNVMGIVWVPEDEVLGSFELGFRLIILFLFFPSRNGPVQISIKRDFTSLIIAADVNTFLHYQLD